MLGTILAVAVHGTVGIGECAVLYCHVACTVCPEAVLYALGIECTSLERYTFCSIQEAQTVDVTILISYRFNTVCQTVIVFGCTLGCEVLEVEGRTIPSLCYCSRSIVDNNALLALAHEGQFLVSEQRQLVLAVHQCDSCTALGSSNSCSECLVVFVAYLGNAYQFDTVNSNRAVGDIFTIEQVFNGSITINCTVGNSNLNAIDCEVYVHLFIE